MKKILTTAIVIAFLFPIIVQGQNFLSTNGKAIVNEEGDTIILRGMGLGGWMLQEGYMMQTTAFATAQYQIRNKIEELIGEANTDAFYEAWLANHCTKADIDSLSAWGFNSVRLPMHYKLYTLPIEDEPVPGEHTWLNKGFELTDSLVSWCAQNEMYVVLDLHGAPGGQGQDQAISDYDPTKPSLWESVDNRDKCVALWQQLAERYVDEPWVAGYDLLNEPNWPMTGNAPLRNLYNRLTDSIRAIDQKHILFIEGNWFANDFTGLTPPWDDNMVYAPHKYWSHNETENIQWVLTLRDQYDIPLYFGESGENSNTWFRDAIKLIEDEGIGWAWWPMKKIESIAGPLSITKSPEYQTLLNYWENGGAQPNAFFANATLMQLTEDIKIENCFFQKDVIDAMIRQPHSNETKPYSHNAVPGVVYATNFDMGVVGEAYNDNAVANYHLSTGSFTPWNNGWAYRNDGIDIEPCIDGTTNGFSVGWQDAGDWMQYELDITEEAVYDINVRTASDAFTGQYRMTIDGADIVPNRYVPNTGGWQTWQTNTLSNIVLSPSDKKLRFEVLGEGFNLNYFEFVQGAVTTEIATEFVSAVTVDEHTVQLNLNKHIAAPLPTSPANFELFVDGLGINILSAIRSLGNPRVILFETDHTFEHGQNIRITYTGTAIFATDVTILETFDFELVRNTLPIVTPIPGRLEAEDFFFQSGVQIENCFDTGGGKNIAHLDAGDYVDLFVDVDETATLNVSYRTASESETGAVDLQIVGADGVASTIQTTNFSPTGNWQTWETTIGGDVILPQGKRQLRIVVTEPQFNLNWLEFSLVTPTNNLAKNFSVAIYPNPNQGQFILHSQLPKRQDVQLSITNLLGQKIYGEVLENMETLHEEISISHLPAGAYFIVLQLTEEGKQVMKKIIVE